MKTVKQPKLLASLDVESLFTNVPINYTLNIIIDAVYNHPDLPLPSFSQDILRDRLLICTTETPFRAPDKSIYQQIDGVSMGTPLGPMLANFYMCHLGNSCFQNCPQIKPPTYCRYIDDIFMLIDIKQIENLKSYFEEHSKLSFTYEIESCKELSFVDTIRRNKEQLRSAVYRKPTNIGECLNYSSICPIKYKTGVIKNFLHRAHNICSDYTSLTTEIARIKQLLINNNFPNYLVDQVTKEFINKKQNKLHAQNKRDTANTEQQTNQVEFYYRNQTTSNYKQVEKELTTIIKSSIETTNEAKLKYEHLLQKLGKLKTYSSEITQTKPIIHST